MTLNSPAAYTIYVFVTRLFSLYFQEEEDGAIDVLARDARVKGTVKLTIPYGIRTVDVGKRNREEEALKTATGEGKAVQ